MKRSVDINQSHSITSSDTKESIHERVIHALVSREQGKEYPDSDESEAIPAGRQKWSNRRKSDSIHPIISYQTDSVQRAPHSTANKLADKRRHSMVSSSEDEFGSSLSLQDKQVLESNQASSDRNCRPSNISFITKEQRGQFHQRDQWSPSRTRYSFKGQDRHRLPAINDKMQNAQRRTSLTTFDNTTRGNSLANIADTARRNSMINVESDRFRHSQSDIRTSDPDVYHRRYSQVNSGTSGLPNPFSNASNSRRNSLASTANVDASLLRNNVPVHDGLARRRNSWANSGAMSPCDRRHTLASEIGNMKNNALLSKICPDFVNPPNESKKHMFYRTSSGNALVKSFSIQQKPLQERDITKDALSVTSRENIICNRRARQLQIHHSFDSHHTDLERTRKLEGLDDMEHMTCKSKLPLPGISPSSNTESNARSSPSFRPKSCWCLRCQFMLTMHRIGDDHLENWGNYPCFRGRQDFRSQTPPAKMPVEVESDIDSQGLPPVDCEIGRANNELVEIEMMMEAAMNIEEQGGIQSFQDIETVEEENTEMIQVAMRLEARMNIEEPGCIHTCQDVTNKDENILETEEDTEEIMSIGTDQDIKTT